MKKVLSLVLVAVLVIGMGSTAFAAWTFTGSWGQIVNLENIKKYAPSYGLISGYDESKFGYKMTYNTNQGINSVGYHESGVIDMGTVHPTDKPGLDIYLWNFMFQGEDILTSGDETRYAYTLDLERMASRGLLRKSTLKISEIDTWAEYEAEAVADWQFDAIYKKLGISSSMGTSEVARKFGDYFYANSLMKIEKYNPDKELYFYQNLDHTGWDWSPYTLIVDHSDSSDGRRVLTVTEIQKSGIKLNTQVSGNSAPIKECKLYPEKGLVQFRIVEEWVSTAKQNFEIVMFLTINGKRFDNQTVTIIGAVENKKIPVYANMDYVDISEGYVADPQDFNTGIAVYIGNGITIHTKMFKDKLYYGITKRVDDEEATRVMKAHPEVSNVIDLLTVGLNNITDYVTFSTDYAAYYVYDADLNYLGKADEKIEFSTRYYLADEMIDPVDEEPDEEPEPDDEPEPTDNPGTGGSTTAPNVNHNPGTGR